MNNKRTNNRKPRSNSRSNGASNANRAPKKDKDEEVRYKGEKPNDWNWYVKDASMLQNAASLSFNNALGNPVEFTVYNANHPAQIVFPGVGNIYTVPSPGYVDKASDAINIASKSIYSWIRHQNSGSANYDAPDLMLYLMAMDSAYAFYAWMTRVYGLAVVFAQQNKYYGDGMVLSSHVDANDIKRNLANFRTYINMYAYKLSAFCIPSDMNIFKRHMWMFANSYRDDNTLKSQVYMYQPAALHVYDEYHGAGRLKTIPVLCEDSSGVLRPIATPLTLTGIMNIGDSILAPLVGSQDINIMSGDILKAYGGNTWHLETIPENYAIVPVYSPEVLDQIHNTVFTGGHAIELTYDSDIVRHYVDGIPSLQAFNVEQETSVGDGFLYTKLSFENAATLACSRLIDFDKEEIHPEDVMVATRNVIMGKQITAVDENGQNSLNLVVPDVVGCDVCLFFGYTQINGVGSIAEGVLGVDPRQQMNIGQIATLSHFNRHPYFIPRSSANAAPDVTAIVGDVGNYTMVEHDVVKKMHETALMSLYAVPSLNLLQTKG